MIGRRELTRRRAPEPRLAAARGTLRPGARGALSVLRRPARHREESVDPSAPAPRGPRRGRAAARVAGNAVRDPGALGAAAPAPRGGARTPRGDAGARPRA